MAAGAQLNVVYPLGPTPGDHVELRYSLRSVAAHLPQARVWIVGNPPPKWATGVEYIPVRQNRGRYQNTTANMAAAARRINGSWLLMNDDIYLLKPGPYAVVHGGPLQAREQWCRRWGYRQYAEGLRQARNLLTGWGHAPAGLLSYDLHTPMLIHSTAFLGMVERAGAALPHSAKRTIYGNANHLGGVRVRDPKVNGRGPFKTDGPYLSTANPTQLRGRLGAFLKARFPTPCRFERK